MQVQRLAALDSTAQHRLMQRSAADVQRVLPQVQSIMEGVRDAACGSARILRHFDRWPWKIAASVPLRYTPHTGRWTQRSWKVYNAPRLEQFHRQQLPQRPCELQPGVRTGRLWRQ
jgi:hypothetical protein